MKTNLLRKVVLTEKTSVLLEDGVYVFDVAPKSNKVEIKQFIQSHFGVKVKSVNFAKVKGKVRRRGRIVGSTPDRKKAYVKLAPGESIDSIKGLL